VSVALLTLLLKGSQMVNRYKLREGGYNEEEIDKIDAYCIAQEQAGTLDNTPNYAQWRTGACLCHGSQSNPTRLWETQSQEEEVCLAVTASTEKRLSRILVSVR
jgi:hypothetical protein